jgi:hypothetical protein
MSAQEANSACRSGLRQQSEPWRSAAVLSVKKRAKPVVPTARDTTDCFPMQVFINCGLLQSGWLKEEGR